MNLNNNFQYENDQITMSTAIFHPFSVKGNFLSNFADEYTGIFNHEGTVEKNANIH